MKKETIKMESIEDEEWKKQIQKHEKGLTSKP